MNPNNINPSRETLMMDLAHSAPEALRLLLQGGAKKRDQALHNQLLKKLVIQYASAEYELHRLNQVKNKLLGTAAHDIRNPLISIRGLADILLAQDIGPLTNDQQELVAMMRTASHDLITLVNDLLDISVIESGKLQLACQPTDLVALTKDRVRLLQLQADQKSIAIRFDGKAPLMFTMDARRMAQVIDNLVGNAVKFSPSGSVVKINIEVRANRVYWRVVDEGPGIAADERSLLFGAFQKLSSRPTAGESSTGLGLAISHKIVTAHGGRINVTSPPNHGSQFEVVLPSGVIDD